MIVKTFKSLKSQPKAKNLTQKTELKQQKNKGFIDKRKFRNDHTLSDAAKAEKRAQLTSNRIKNSKFSGVINGFGTDMVYSKLTDLDDVLTDSEDESEDEQPAAVTGKANTLEEKIRESKMMRVEKQIHRDEIKDLTLKLDMEHKKTMRFEYGKLKPDEPVAMQDFFAEAEAEFQETKAMEVTKKLVQKVDEEENDEKDVKKDISESKRGLEQIIYTLSLPQFQHQMVTYLKYKMEACDCSTMNGVLKKSLILEVLSNEVPWSGGCYDLLEELSKLLILAASEESILFVSEDLSHLEKSVLDEADGKALAVAVIYKTVVALIKVIGTPSNISVCHTPPKVLSSLKLLEVAPTHSNYPGFLVEQMSRLSALLKKNEVTFNSRFEGKMKRKIQLTRQLSPDLKENIDFKKKTIAELRKKVKSEVRSIRKDTRKKVDLERTMEISTRKKDADYRKKKVKEIYAGLGNC